MEAPVPARPAGFSSAASKGYALVSAWEKNAVLSASQLAAVSLLRGCGDVTEPEHLADDALQASAALSDTTQAADSSATENRLKGDWQGAVLRSSHQFYKWYSELAVVRREQVQGEYAEYLESLTNRLQLTQEITGRVDGSLAALDGLQGDHTGVVAKMAQIKKSCERLMHEKEMLLEYANALSSRLGTFGELEEISTEFTRLATAPDSVQGGLKLLTRLDECLDYMSSNPTYVDTMAYTLRLRQLQGKVIGLISSNVQRILQKAAASARVDAERAVGSPTAAAPDDAGGTALACVRFRAAVEPQLSPILEALEARRASGEVVRLLGNLEGSFCAVRAQAALPRVQRHVAALRASLSLREQARKGCAYLLDVARAEASLVTTFFPAPEPTPAQAQLVETLCNALYDALRPQYIQLRDTDDLADLVDVLRQVVHADAMSHRDTPAGRLLEPTVQRIVSDVQGRLMFRAAAFLREEVADFRPAPADVDFPACLLRHADAAAADADAAAAAASPPTPSSAAGPAAPPRDAHATWYPPLRQTLVCLARLYRSVDFPAFSGIAQDALKMCSASITAASRLVAKQAGALDGHLFAIRHLLLLREQISPFHADFTAHDRDLDLSHMRGQLHRVLTGQVPIFGLSKDSAVAALGGGVRVTESAVDCKQELEKALKAACEAAIMAVTKLVVEPLLGFLHKKAGEPKRRIGQYAFAAPARVAAVVTAVNSALDTTYPAAVDKLRLYLTKPRTQDALLRPIRSNIADAHGHVRALLREHYSEDEAAGVPLRGEEELEGLLGGAVAREGGERAGSEDQ